MRLGTKMLALFTALAASSSFAAPRTAFVHLFEWKWDDIAVECEQFLGPKGFAAVQVSPPQKSVWGDNWWTRYQPVSYEIIGRSGNREQFQNMVNRCSAVGVDIYVDAVINHMAAWDRHFPEVPFYREHFHDCWDSIDYGNAGSVQFCDLVGLNDLKTEDWYVQQKIADYLNDLTRMGVKGFRIDAAKHIPPKDIKEIINRLEGNPYIFQEVIQANGEAVQPYQYVSNGNVTEFRFERKISEVFRHRSLGELRHLIGHDWLRSEEAVVFVSNHDDQRQHREYTITYKDQGNLNYLAEIAMLAYPYGYPKVMSSYYFDDGQHGENQGPPYQGVHSGDRCFDGGWVCEHRWRGIANMVEFRNHTSSDWYISNWWENPLNSNQIAFSRGDKGFVVLNRDYNYNVAENLNTGMPEGTYCDIINGNFNKTEGTCDGPTIDVSSNGYASFNVTTLNASAIHVGARVGDSRPNPEGTADVTFNCLNGDTIWGQSVFVVGNIAELGNWQPANAVKLAPENYPNWTAMVTLPRGTTIEWKCIKRDNDDAGKSVVWQGGPNNQINADQDGTATGSF